MTQSNHVLLTGANGYIGRRLLQKLLEQGHYVTCLVRDKRRFEINHEHLDQMQVAEGDLLKPETLKDLPKEIDAAYFLVHSMSGSYQDFEAMERQTAENFRYYIDQTSCSQIIFLSGIMNEETLSRHFQSRLNVEEILKSSKVSVTILRAGIIIGSGSASFEIMRDLVYKLPVMVAPKWLKNRIQPIALRDVLYYLSSVLLMRETYQKTYDVGGPEVLTYKDLLKKMADIRGKKLWIINVPVLTPKLSAYWLYFVTATSFSLARSLVESLKHEIVVRKKGIETILPCTLTSFEQAVKLAYARIDGNQVDSSWKDSLVSGTMGQDFLDKGEVPTVDCMIDDQIVPIDQPKEQVKTNIWQIGGDNGWYFLDWLWEIRGLLDKMLGGVGLRRGRRSPVDLTRGDALDFWRVLYADRDKGYLLLYAEMKVPGEAWLAFRIDETDNGEVVLNQRATFRPYKFWGKLYWYGLLPIHIPIFRGMANQIAKKSLGSTFQNKTA